MIRRLERNGIPHNLVAHPLLILCPPLGRWLHQRTEPTVPTIYALHRDRVDAWPRFHLFRRSTR